MKNQHPKVEDENWIRRIKDWLRESQMSHESLARALGCTRGAVGHYLAGRRHPTLTQLQHIAEVMGVHPIRLIYGIEPTGVAEPGTAYKPAPNCPPQVPLLGSTLTGPQSTPIGHLELAGLPVDVYALIVTGNSCAPRAYDDDILLLSGALVPGPGDDVLIRLATGETTVCELVSTRGGRAALRTIGEHPGQIWDVPDDLDLLHRVVGMLRSRLVSVFSEDASAEIQEGGRVGPLSTPARGEHASRT